ncbi:unnamed protein product [Phytomonas sp. EM1]|nr:unnamed protein product [Phytomonas sp. EM1]|eukprot:CCW64825.1 unnamed protein product [Phytomonas sp. isolate EM1]
MPHYKQSWAKRVKKERFKKKYLTRMQATRLLQVDAIRFRRLCILKGIYPRALARSKQKLSGDEKQYYLAKEIKWLVRDQLTDKMMAHRAWERKVKRAEAMGKKDDLKILQSVRVKPQHSLVATIKERYPYFVDALRDVDDAMTMISLYAFLSPEIRSESNVEVHHSLTSGMHEKAKNICEEWNRFVARSQVLTKGFISIKGYYFEALVRGERIRWLCPHEYAHKFPKGIQQYIMLSFLEFYLELMRFVLVKLNRDLARDLEERERIADEGVNANAENFPTEEVLRVEAGDDGRGLKPERKDATGGDAPAARGDVKAVAGRLQLMERELQAVRGVFAGLRFSLSREVPAKHARLVIEACGGRVLENAACGVALNGPAGAPGDLPTHVVMDRPSLPPGMRPFERAEYVQPQYLFDCLNARALLPVAGYRLGEELPPHVSPFTVAISNNPEDVAAIEEAKRRHPRLVSYVPQRVHEIRKLLHPGYTPLDADGTLAALEDGELSEDEAHVAVPELDADDDVSLSEDELNEARRRPAWEEEGVTENVERSKLSALKVKKQRERNTMNAPTDEVVARRRQAILRAREAKRQEETNDQRVRRKLREAKRQEAATRKMQLQVARKKAARYYKMVNGVVQSGLKKATALEAKAKHLEQGKLRKSEDGKGLVNTRLEAKQKRAEAKGKKLKQKKADNPYKKLPKWVR